MSFSAYLKKEKRNFQPQRFIEDLHYRSVMFHQFGESYRYYCKRQRLADEYEKIAYEVRLYEQRLAAYREK